MGRLARVSVALAMAASLTACVGSGGGDVSEPMAAPSTPKKKCTVSAKLVPSCGAWWGVTPLTGPDPTAAVHTFERVIGRPVDIYHGYHRGSALFPTAGEIALTREPGHHRKLMLNWKPDDGMTWRQIAQGAMDATIDREAAYLRANFRQRFWLVIHHEPEDEVRERPGSGYTAEDYRAMFRHIVTEFHTHGVRNVLFTVVFMGFTGYMARPWFKTLYPGDDVVDWVGFDPFAKSNIKDYANLVNKVATAQQRLGFPGFYDYSARYFPDKPLMLSEWAVLEQPGNPARKAAFFRSVARQFAKFPRVKALAYYDTPHAANMPDGGNTRIDTSAASLRAFRFLSARSEFNVRR
jgi:hypothetical protein